MVFDLSAKGRCRSREVNSRSRRRFLPAGRARCVFRARTSGTGPHPRLLKKWADGIGYREQLSARAAMYEVILGYMRETPCIQSHQFFSGGSCGSIVSAGMHNWHLVLSKKAGSPIRVQGRDRWGGNSCRTSIRSEDRATPQGQTKKTRVEDGRMDSTGRAGEGRSGLVTVLWCG